MKYEEKVAKAEIACAGIAVPCTTYTEAWFLFQEIAEQILGFDFDDKPDFFFGEDDEENYEVAYMLAYNVLPDTPVICVVLSSDEDEVKPFEEDFGTGFPSAFCYVYNLRHSECSEYDDVFFKKHTIGEKVYYTRAR